MHREQSAVERVVVGDLFNKVQRACQNSAIAVFFPFQNRAWTDSKFSADFQGHQGTDNRPINEPQMARMASTPLYTGHPRHLRLNIEINFPRSGNQRRCSGKKVETNFEMNGEAAGMPFAMTRLS
jgi:hypothetical protein